MMKRGFTLVEILIVVIVIGILSVISVVSYQHMQASAADKTTGSSVVQANEALQVYFTSNKDYPPNLAAVNYVPPENTVIALYTNAPVIRKYSAGSLSESQNAQLFLNSCSAHMPIEGGGTTYYNTGCQFQAGKKIHVKGQAGSNVLIDEPVENNDFVFTCGAVCDAAANAIIQDFTEQGGTFPIMVPPDQVALPEPDIIETAGNATDYCLEGRSNSYGDSVYHIAASDNGSLKAGACPDPAASGLHYP